jgi:hypothetical protein
MASSVKFISTTTTGRVNDTPITQCIHCRDKTPNPGFPFCNDCHVLRSAGQQPCCACKKTPISRIPFTKLTRMYCSICTEKYKATKEKGLIAVPKTREEKTMESKYAESEQKRLSQMFEGMSQLQIVNIVYDMLEAKEQFIQDILNDNDLLKFQIEKLSE